MALDYWDKKGNECVANCVAGGMRITAMYVEEIVQQRAELLEALKKCRFDSLNMTIEDWRFVQEAIKKAEAAE